MFIISRILFTKSLSLVLALLFTGAASSQTPAPQTERSFTLLEFVVEGNTKLERAVIEQAIYPFMGPGKTITDVESAREALEKVFQNAGFVTISVDIPEQSVRNGVVRLQVSEGTIDRISVRGAKYFSASEIRNAVPALETGSVPNVKDLQQQIATLNRNPNRRVTPSLKPGKSPGTVDVELSVDDSLPLGGSVALSNFKTATGTTSRLSADVRFENVGSATFGTGHTLGISLFVTPENTRETKVFSANYLAPMSDSSTLMAYLVASNSESVEPVGSSVVQGKLRLFGLRYFRTLAERPGARWSLSFGADRKSNEQLVATPDGAGPIVYYPVSLGSSLTLGSTANLWKVDLGIVQGIGSGTKNQEAFEQRRLGSSPDFTVFKLDLAHEQNISERLRFRGRFGTHLTANPLLNLEQASAGGYDSVRGYFEAEQLGDRALRLSTELVYNFTVPQGTLRRAELVSFFDAAQLKVVSPAVGQVDRFKLLSIGLGARLRLGNSFNWVGELAYPLKATPQTAKGDWRFLTRLTYDY